MLPGIGIFGTGPVVKVLVPFLRDNGFKIEAIWSRTVEEAKDTAKELQIQFFTTKIDDVLLRKGVDLIFVLCSPNLHAQISVKALGIGKHVVCDKPAGLNQSDALKMVRAGQYYPTLISLINHSFRFLPAFIHMKKSITDNYLETAITLIDVRVQSGTTLFGDIDTFNWQCDDTMGGGTLNLIGSHVIDLISYLTGQRAVRVHGLVKNFTKYTKSINGIRQITAPDFCTFQMELLNGILVTVTVNSHTIGSNFQQEVLVCSTNGHLAVRGGDLFGRRNNSTEEVIYLDVEDLKFPTPNSVLPKPFVKGLSKMVSALSEAFLPQGNDGWIKEPVSTAATFDDGLYVQAVLQAIRQSSQTRQWVKVNIMTEQPDKNELLSAVVRRTAISMS